jgi:hypothetical protein
MYRTFRIPNQQWEPAKSAKNFVNPVILSKDPTFGAGEPTFRASQLNANGVR